jgi:hypothetical protein
VVTLTSDTTVGRAIDSIEQGLLADFPERDRGEIVADLRRHAEQPFKEWIAGRDAVLADPNLSDAGKATKLDEIRAEKMPATLEHARRKAAEFDAEREALRTRAVAEWEGRNAERGLEQLLEQLFVEREIRDGVRVQYARHDNEGKPEVDTRRLSLAYLDAIEKRHVTFVRALERDPFGLLDEKTLDQGRELKVSGSSLRSAIERKQVIGDAYKWVAETAQREFENT